MKKRLLWPVGIALLVVAQVLWYIRQETPLFGVAAALPGLVLLLSGRGLLPASAAPTRLTEQPAPQAKFGLLRCAGLAAGVGLVFLASWLGNLWSPESPRDSAWLIVVLWLMSACLVFVSLIGMSAIRLWMSKVRHSLHHDWPEWMVVLILMMAGLILRLIWLDHLPAVLSEDEARFGVIAAQFAQGWHGSPLRFDPLLNQPMIFHLAQAVSIRLFGQTILAVRLPSAFVGAAAIPGIYLASRRMFSPRVALIAATLLVTLPVHVHFSRIALNNIVDPTIAIWSMAFLVGAVRSGDPVEYGLVGLMLGLSQYGYSSSRLIPVMAAIYVALVMVRRHQMVAGQAKGLLITLIVGTVLLLPLASWLLAFHIPLNPRLRDVAAWASVPSLHGLPADSSQYVGYWLNQTSQSIFAYIQIKETGLYYGHMVPFLGWIMPVFLLIGLAILLNGWRDPNRLIVIIWVAMVTLVGGVLTTEPPQYQRIVLVIPFLVIMIAVGVQGAVLAFPQNVIRLASFLIIFVLVVTDLKTYPVDYLNDKPYFTDTRTQAMNFISTDVLPKLGGYTIWYLPTWWFDVNETPIIRYRVPRLANVTEFKGTPDEFLTAIRNTPGKQAVFIPVDYTHSDQYYLKVLALPNVKAAPFVPISNGTFALLLIGPS